MLLPHLCTDQIATREAPLLICTTIAGVQAEPGAIDGIVVADIKAVIGGRLCDLSRAVGEGKVLLSLALLARLDREAGPTRL